MPTRSRAQPSSENVWRKLLIDGNEQLRMAHRLFRHLPSAPRCKLCHNPFGGIGGKVMGLMGFYPSRKNPNLCAHCCDNLPLGGVEVDVAVLFADVRGSTALGERIAPHGYAVLLNRFYRVATETLVRHDAIIDKLIGDEVMALFIPGICGPEYRLRAVQAAHDLLRAMGYGAQAGPWLPIHGSVNAGLAYVGNVGGDGIVDFTALGDTINTGSRMQHAAVDGQFLLGEGIYASMAGRFPGLDRRTLMIEGKESPLGVRVLDGRSKQ
jgi:adenylate cyclase